MSMKYTPIALFICSSFVLTACSGGGNKSTAVPESPKVIIQPSQNAENSKPSSDTSSKANSANTSETGQDSHLSTNLNSSPGEKPAENDTPSDDTSIQPNSILNTKNESNPIHTSETEHASNPSTGLNIPTEEKKVEDVDIETMLDSNKQIKWRQLSTFITSNDSEVDNPLSEKANGKISPQKGAAAYINGDSKYNDNGIKDFRNPQTRQNTMYDSEFLTKAEINPHKLQHYAIKNNQGNTVASTHFVNQKYSSYLSWKSEKPAIVGDTAIETVMAGYVAVPTNADKAILERKVKATYQGHTIGNRDRHGNEFTLGNIQLDADFENMQISGIITGRNDELLNHRVKYQGSGFKKVTTDSEEVEEGYTKLISESEMADRYEKHRKLDVKLLPADIKVENGVISFKKSSDALEFKALNGDTVTTGSYGGIFAGPNAEEVVGEIQGSDNFISFGATEVKK